MRLHALVFTVSASMSACSGPELDARVGPEDVAGEAWPLSIPYFDVNCGNGTDIYAVHEGFAYVLRGDGGDDLPGLSVRSMLEVRKYDPRMAKLSPSARLPMEETRRVALARCVAAGQASFTDY